MFCEAYDQSLKDAVATGEELSPALHKHLASCESCRAAFAEEQSLFTAIDSGLRAAANPEVPSTLIPRVHVALNNEPAPQSRSFNFLAWGSAGAFVTAAVVLALVYLPPRHQAPSGEPARPAQVTAVKNGPDQPPLNPAGTVGVSTVQQKKAAIQVVSRDSKAESPEVLVPDEERAAFAKFMAHASPSSANVLVSAALVPRAPKDSVQISPVEIAGLEPIPLDQKEVRHGQF